MKKPRKLHGTYFKSIDSLINSLDAVRTKKDRVVLTQGVFDLIHEGHAKYLELAKTHGTILIVGIDSDRLTKQRKGPNRPIVPQKERIDMLLHLRHVDAVVLRDIKDDIGDLIRAVKPDVLITSTSTKDFTKELVDEYREHCKEIITLPPQSTTSTTARIRELTIDGAAALAKEINALTLEFINKIRNA